MNSYSLSTITTGAEITVKGCEYAVPPISCGPNQQILNNGMIKYGRWDNSVCPPVNPENPFNYTIYSLQNRCVGQNSCILGRRGGLFDLRDPYVGTVKHFEITYSCGLFPLMTTDDLMKVENSGCQKDNANLLCPVNYDITDGFFMYGRWDNKLCPAPGVNYSTPISYEIFDLPPDCLQGATHCEILNGSKIFGDPSTEIIKHVGYYIDIFISFKCTCTVALKNNLQ